MERRRFNTRERVTAYLFANGKCEDCGVELEPGWHGHHHIPWSRGGPTDAMNARALCPLCNWRRGNKMPVKPPDVERFYDREHPERKPREWQDEWYEIAIQTTSRNMLLVACPAAGKTVAALRDAHAR